MKFKSMEVKEGWVVATEFGEPIGEMERANVHGADVTHNVAVWLNKNYSSLVAVCANPAKMQADLYASLAMRTSKLEENLNDLIVNFNQLATEWNNFCKLAGGKNRKRRDGNTDTGDGNPADRMVQEEQVDETNGTDQPPTESTGKTNL